jgi:hypothetical protein
VVLSLVLLAGCETELETVYGQRSGPGASKSVNGTAVLARMVERAGHRVYSWRRLSPRLHAHADCIVWFPDDFEPPSPKVIDWLEGWMKAKPGRTLIYVGRDFDATPNYWRSIRPQVPSEEQPEIERRLAKAEFWIEKARKESLKTDTTEWFSIDEEKPREVKTLSGQRRWIEGVDASKLQIQLRRRIVPEIRVQTLLRSNGDVLVARAWRGLRGSRLILVVNGSFLLNMPLVNREHRKLAGRLIEEIGPGTKEVAFLESDADSPLIQSKDPATTVPTGFELLRAWPTNWILMHLIAAAVIFCFSRWPIFGTARRDDDAHASDFGKHVDALAETLKRSQDREYAMSRVRQYRQGDAMKQ